MLKVTTEPLEKCQVLMTIEVDDAQADQLLKAAAKRISTQVQIPGFRPGKAPYSLIVRRFGEEVIREEALEDLSGKVFREALKQVNLEPFAPASMEEVSWQPLVMKVRVPLEPVVELGDYSALRLESPPIEVTEEEVDQELAAMQEKYASWETVERPARIGDQVVLSLRSEVDGNVLSRENVTVLVRDPNDDPKYAAILNALIGMSSGDECTTTIPFASPSGREEASEGEKNGDEETEPRGADAEMNVWIKVHAVQEKHLYPLDDDFAQMVGDFDTIQGLREKVRAALVEKRQKEIERQQTAQTVEHIVSEMSRVEWPPVLEELAIDRWVSGLEQRLKQQGMPLQAYLRTQQKSLEQLREEIRPRVQQQLRRSLVLQEIARREGISVEPDEVLRYIELMAAAGDQQNVLPSTLSRETLRQIFQDLLDAKVYTRLSEILKGEVQEAAVEPTAETQKAVESPVESPDEISEVSPEASAGGAPDGVLTPSEG